MFLIPCPPDICIIIFNTTRKRTEVESKLYGQLVLFRVRYNSIKREEEGFVSVERYVAWVNKGGRVVYYR